MRSKCRSKPLFRTTPMVRSSKNPLVLIVEIGVFSRTRTRTTTRTSHPTIEFSATLGLFLMICVHLRDLRAKRLADIARGSRGSRGLTQMCFLVSAIEISMRIWISAFLGIFCHQSPEGADIVHLVEVRFVFHVQNDVFDTLYLGIRQDALAVPAIDVHHLVHAQGIL